MITTGAIGIGTVTTIGIGTTIETTGIGTIAATTAIMIGITVITIATIGAARVPSW